MIGCPTEASYWGVLLEEYFSEVGRPKNLQEGQGTTREYGWLSLIIIRKKALKRAKKLKTRMETNHG